MAFRCGEGTSEDHRVGGCLQGALERGHICWKPVAGRLQAKGRGVSEGKAKENENNSSCDSNPQIGNICYSSGRANCLLAVAGCCVEHGGSGSCCYCSLTWTEPWDLRHVQKQSPVSPKPGVQGWRWGTPPRPCEKKANPCSISLSVGSGDCPEEVRAPFKWSEKKV